MTVAIQIKAEEKFFLRIFVEARDSAGFAELLEIERAGFVDIEMIEETSVCHLAFTTLPFSAWCLALAQHGRKLGTIGGGDFSIAIGIKAAKQGFDSLRWKIGEHFSRAEFLKADATAAIGIQLHQATHAKCRPLTAFVLPDFAKFSHAHFSIRIFIKTLEELHLFVFGEPGNPWHGLKLLGREKSVAIGIVFFPHGLE